MRVKPRPQLAVACQNATSDSDHLHADGRWPARVGSPHSHGKTSEPPEMVTKTQPPALKPPSAWLMLPLLGHRGLPGSMMKRLRPSTGPNNPVLMPEMSFVSKFDTAYFVTIDINILWHVAWILEGDLSCHISSCLWLQWAGGVRQRICRTEKVLRCNRDKWYMGKLRIGNFWRVPA